MCTVKARELAFLVALEDREVLDIWHAVVNEFNKKEKSSSSSSSSTHANHEKKGENYQGDLYDSVTDVLHTVTEQLKLNIHSVHFLPIWDFFRQYTQRFCDILSSESKLRRKSIYDNLSLFSDDLHRHDLVIGKSLFQRYLKSEDLTVLDLNNVFNGRNSHLPSCIFHVVNLEKLCLANNQLRAIPADIGRLTRLHTLILSNNRLKNDSIPFTLSFCWKTLHTLLLDNNLLDAIPGFVLNLPNLRTLHRHGNQNYFRSTFMWYGCESRERIRTASFSDVDVASTALQCATQVQSLQFWAARTIISTKVNYFNNASLSEMTKNYISYVYRMFNICDACNTASLLHAQGYFVFTFQNPYLGNTCVPFQHWTCSRECALKVEVPARKRQVQMAKLMQRAYNAYVSSVNREIGTIEEHPHQSASLLCARHTNRDNKRHRLCKIM